MNLLSTDNIGFDSAIVRLGEMIRELAQSDLSESDTACGRIEVKLPDTDPLIWLGGQDSPGKVYYRSRPNGEISEEIAGIGEADRVRVDHAPVDFKSITDQINKKLNGANGSCRYFGGFGFHAEQDHADDSFRNIYGAANLVLPRFEVVRKTEGSFLGCNLLREDLECQATLNGIIEEANAILKPARFPGDEIPTVISREDLPDKKTWCRRVENCVLAIDEQELEKIVLARKSTFSFTRGLNPWELIDGFRSKNFERFLFAFQPEPTVAFLSTTPELLYARDQRHITSEALAGTRPRSDDQAEDTRLAEQLMKSRKERREYAYVEHQVAANLADLCDGDLSRTDVSLVKLEHVQHLIARFEGKLRENVNDADLLGALHPTPAVGGSPRDKAVDLIRSLETFDRGWYAGPIGWISADAALFAVGIRSGTIHNNKLTLYSGAGIVEGSLPVREWAEIENKIAGFLSLLTR